MIYDLIGDIHGFITPLQKLLKKLDYKQIDDYSWQPPENHRAVFLGDYIDRGADSVAVLKIVKAMTDMGFAIALLGNHEYNAINYHTLNKESQNSREYLRPHSDKNRKQHRETLDDFDKQGEKIEPWIEWFKSLPIFFETEKIIALHACPLQKDLKVIKDHPEILKNHLTDSFIEKAARKGNREYKAIENLLKGPEYPLPDDVYFEDKDKIKRTNIRLNWWALKDSNKQILNWNDLALSVSEDGRKKLKGAFLEPFKLEAIRNKIQIPLNKMIFIGHYWKTGAVKKMTDHVICLDYSVGKGGELAAYSIDDEYTDTEGTFTVVS